MKGLAGHGNEPKWRQAATRRQILLAGLAAEIAAGLRPPPVGLKVVVVVIKLGAA